jgi:hypothetical protein
VKVVPSLVAYTCGDDPPGPTTQACVESTAPSPESEPVNPLGVTSFAAVSPTTYERIFVEPATTASIQTRVPLMATSVI